MSACQVESESVRRRLFDSPQISVVDELIPKLLRTDLSLNTPSPFNWLIVPDEVIHKTLFLLKKRDFQNFASLDRRTYSISKRPLLWQELCELKWGINDRCKFHRKIDPLPLPRLSWEWKHFMEHHMTLVANTKKVLRKKIWSSTLGSTTLRNPFASTNQ